MNILNFSSCKDLSKDSFHLLLIISGSLMKREDLKLSQWFFLRNHDEFYMPTSRLHSFDNFPLYSFPRTWVNFHNENIKFTPNVLKFNLSLQTILSIICLQLLYVSKLIAHLVIIFSTIGSDLLFTSLIF